ncbi:MAG TPA: hypothetical protein VHE33_00630, partial [Acidobacteriaceae bacterium]|nr:hypothetical protein [Acidobacteriaceae bacterium]
IYPVQLKTKANQQWAAQRETQRRIRLALEEHGMLPGDPMRVYARNGDPRSATGVPGATAAKGHEHAAEKTDPTATKPAEGNPLTGE